MKKHLDEKTLKKIETKIRNLEQELINENNDEVFEISSEIVDAATRETMIIMQINKKKHKQRMLNEIKNALKKINNGTYGICEESGEPIELSRLEVNPLARYTIETQKELEESSKIH